MTNIEFRYDIRDDMADYKKVYNLIDEATPLELCQLDNHQATLLHTAAYYGGINYYKGNYKICELLIAKMTPETLNIKNNNGWTALDVAVYYYNERAAIRLIPEMTLINLENALKKAIDVGFWQIENILKMILSKS